MDAHPGRHAGAGGRRNLDAGKEKARMNWRRHGWIAVLLAGIAASAALYAWQAGEQQRALQAEITHRSSMKLAAIRSLINQHMDSAQAGASFLDGEMLTHSFVEADEAAGFVQSILNTHPEEFVAIALLPAAEHGDAVRMTTGGKRVAALAPPIDMARFAAVAPDAPRLVLLEDEAAEAGAHKLRMLLAGWQLPHGHAAVDMNIAYIIARAATEGMPAGLDIDVSVLQAAGREINLLHHVSRARKAEEEEEEELRWKGGFDIGGLAFMVRAYPAPELIRQHITRLPLYSALISLIVFLLLAWTVYKRSRYGEYLRNEVAHRTTELVSEQEKLSSVIDHANEGILLMDEQGNILRANPAACRLFGYATEQLQGLSVHDLVPEEIREPHVQWVADELAGKRHDIMGKTRELRGRRRDGSVFPCEVTVNSFETEEGLRLSVILRDLTERKQREWIRETLVALGIIYQKRAPINERLQQMLEKILDEPWEVLLGKGAIFLVEENALHLAASMGWSEEGKACCASVSFGECLCGKVFETGEAQCHLTRPPEHKLAGTSAPDAGYLCLPVMHGKDRLGVMNFTTMPGVVIPKEFHDFCDRVSEIITEMVAQNNAKVLLKASEEKHRNLFESSRDALMLINPPSWKFIDANKATLQLFGASSVDEFTRLGPWDVSPEMQPDGRPSIEKAKEMIAAAMREGSSFFEWQHQRLDGRPFDADVLLTRMKAGGKLFLQATVRDVTDRKRALQALQASESYQRVLVDNSPVGLVLSRMDGRLVDVNPTYARIIGRNVQDTLALSYRDITPQSYAEQEKKKLADLEKTGRYGPYEKEYIHKDGHRVSVRLNGLIIERDGERFIWSSVEDITDIKKSRNIRNLRVRIMESLLNSGYSLQESLEHIVLAVEEYIPGALGSILLMDGESQHLLTGASPHLPEAYNRAIHGVAIGPSVGSCGTAAFLKKQVIVSDIATDPLWESYKDIAAKHQLAACWSQPVMTGEGKVLGTFALYFPEPRSPESFDLDSIMMAANLTTLAIERCRVGEKLSFLSYYDELTGLPNRRLFSDRANQGIAAARREKHPLGLLYLDLDRFKFINDTMGHACGDLVLKEAAKRLQDTLRETDTVARMGGDEFAILLPGADANTAMRVAHKLRDKLQQEYQIGKQEFTLDASIGIAIFPHDGKDKEALLQHADTAMYHAKHNQKHIHYFSSNMEEDARKRLWMEQELAKAADEKQLELYYQSQHAIRAGDGASPFPMHYQEKRGIGDGAIIGMESLVRWNHPKLGLISPAEFIPLAEETGQIRAITRWTLCEAARQAAIWEKAGIRPNRIGVNLSAVQLMQKNLAGEIIERIQSIGAKTEWIEIEITETAAMREPETAILIMRELVDAGISIAIDDFGTGYSSLAYLKRLPAEWLKIDIAFIRDLPGDDEDAAIVRSTIAMAHALGMKTIAEGVETEAQLEFLKGEGCDAVQGYWFSKPLSADEATTHIRRHIKS